MNLRFFVEFDSSHRAVLSLTLCFDLIREFFIPAWFSFPEGVLCQRYTKSQ